MYFMNGRPEPITEAQVTARLNERDRGRCAVCGCASGVLAIYPRSSVHTSSPRFDLAGLLLVCGTAVTGCRQWLSNEPGWARSHGFTVAAHHDPAHVPVEHAVHGLVLLGHDGAVTPVGEEGA
ncbi:hypothetical protein ABZ801_01260 [Actinomadura sp. NPDC047616]|uniref:hypothetical protein n=1 Tax=Actinomadura sp. NPDC047616 TaxID=3155914 RepID=UPI0033FCE0CB